jgi:hypothetical protein
MQEKALLMERLFVSQLGFGEGLEDDLGWT